ncbi:MAG: hypothetical protein HY720_00090 [Planctomycetes bacterium]|nr:hypothetical protein [Planctomycetota bacterium]
MSVSNSISREALVLALFALAAGSPAFAAEVCAALPEDTIAYVEIQGLQELPDALTALPFWTEGGWKGEARTSYEELLFGALGEEMHIEKERAVAFLKTCRRIQAALLPPLPASDGAERGGSPADRMRAIGVLDLADLGPATQLVEREFAELFGQRTAHGSTTVYQLSPEERNPQLFGAFEGSRFVLALGPIETLHDFLDATASGRPASLDSAPRFRELSSEIGGSPLWGYFNPAPLLDWIKGSLDFDDRKQFDQMDALFGFSDVEAVGFSSNFETSPGSVSTRARIFVSADNSFVSLIRSEPVDDEILRLIPETALVAGVASVPDTGKRWQEIRSFIENFEKDVIQDDDFSREVRRFKERMGFDLDEAFSLVDRQVAFVWPSIDGDVDDDDFTMIFRVSDPEKAREILEKAKKEGSRIRGAVEDGSFKSETYRGATLEYVPERFACALVEGYAVLAGSDRAVRAAIDARSGATPSVAARYGTHLVDFASRHSKVLCFDPAFLLGEESETAIAIAHLSKEWGLFLGTVEGESGQLDIEVNASVFGGLAAALHGALEDERTRDARRACTDRLSLLATHLNAYATKNGELPTSLEGALPEGMEPGALRCPLDEGREGDGPSYVYTAIPEGLANPGWWSFPVLYCRNLEHGRIRAEYEGPEQGVQQAYRSSENRFRKDFARMKRAIEEGAKENGHGEDGQEEDGR